MVLFFARLNSSGTFVTRLRDAHRESKKVEKKLIEL
jgi:hypothetical protein